MDLVSKSCLVSLFNCGSFVLLHFIEAATQNNIQYFEAYCDSLLKRQYTVSASRELGLLFFFELPPHPVTCILLVQVSPFWPGLFKCLHSSLWNFFPYGAKCVL